MLAKQACIDGISIDKVASILLSFNRKNRLDNSFNDEEEKSSEGENKGDKDDQFEAIVKKSGKEWGEGNVGVDFREMPAAKQNANSIAAEQCAVDDGEGELEDKSKATSMSMITNAMLQKILRTASASFKTWRVMK